MPGASAATRASPVTAAMTIATCGGDDLGERAGCGEPEPLQRDQARLVDAEHAPQQVLRRDLEDQCVLTEHPRAAEARGDEQRQRVGEPRLAGEREQRHERRRRQDADQPQPPGRGHEPDGHQLARDRARRNRREPPAGSARRQAEMRDVRRSQGLGGDRAGRHEPAEQQHAPDAAVGEHRRHPAERVPEDVPRARRRAPRRRAARGCASRGARPARSRGSSRSPATAPRAATSARSAGRRRRCRRPAPTARRCGRASGPR